ncbi:MAG: YraN family protein [Propionibacteriaceae bacterium]|jgi:putative endonuclease|nr:YraN family protein [Propionibacteriaceae bacterium]
MDRSQTGAAGEDVAADYLRSLGWTVVERNWRCPAGELDIVARTGQTLVFCEVKTRRGTGFCSPLEAITARKLRKLRELSVLWLREHRVCPARVRIDGIGVVWRLREPAQIIHRKGIG